MRTRRTKTVAAAAVARLVGGGTLALSLRGSGEAAPQTSFCWGGLTREDVSALTVEPRERYASEENGAADSGPAHCEVDDEFTLTIESLRSAGSVRGTADEVAAESPVRAPIPGVPGWVNRTYAGALLPADCADALAGPTPYLRIQVTNDQEDTWRNGALQQRMSAVLTTAADRLTETHGCSGPAPGTPPGAGAPTLLEHEELDPARACGLEGFAPLRASADGGFRQAVTGGDLRLWSCVLAASDEDRHSLVHFTVTQEPALVAVHRADDQGRSTLLTCAGRPTLVQVGHFSGRKEGRRRDALRPDADLLAGLADAVAGRAGCERG
ncbi:MULTISPECIES: hypothetical protein [unclassified Streptomyces]|uniref:hypothetical protein n=1 Tax=unclassified Streptomyces TaxID=2593676 RepID=UPI000823F2E5|nr:hypothetical protein [Streptomyces sp. AmelKG-D3]SCK56698.1 hypothetical protein YUWDRAFT_05141 [Streptomyces sp. AmelKG-D3]